MRRVNTRLKSMQPIVARDPLSPLVVSELEAARLVGLGIRTMQQLRAEGTGPRFVRLSARRLGYSLDDLRDWIASRSASSTSDVTVRTLGGTA